MQLSPVTGLKTGLLLLAAVAAAAVAPADELTLAHFMPPTHTLHQEVFQPLADALDEATDGALTLRIYPAGALGKGPVQQYKRVVEGVADITFCIHSYTAALFPLSQLITQPGLLSSAEAGTAKLWDILPAYLANEYREVKLLGLWAMSPTVLITRTHAVHTPADLAGMKVRISSPAESAVVQAWGGVPVAMPVTEAYNALNTGIVDAVLIQPSALYAPWNLAEPGRYVTHNLPSPAATVFLAMNQTRWQQLQPAWQQTLKDLTGRSFSLDAARRWSGKDLDALAQAADDAGIQAIALTPDQRSQFAMASHDLVQAEIQRLEQQGVAADAIYRALAE
jgi:TRAP-type C4-dicarboxylate transport system substrate-binding protein